LSSPEFGTRRGPIQVRHELELTNVGKATAGAGSAWLADFAGTIYTDVARIPALPSDGGSHRFTLTEKLVVNGIERDGSLVVAWSDLLGSHEERLLEVELHS